MRWRVSGARKRTRRAHTYHHCFCRRIVCALMLRRRISPTGLDHVVTDVFSVLYQRMRWYCGGVADDNAALPANCALDDTCSASPLIHRRCRWLLEVPVLLLLGKIRSLNCSQEKDHAHESEQSMSVTMRERARAYTRVSQETEWSMRERARSYMRA